MCHKLPSFFLTFLSSTVPATDNDTATKVELSLPGPDRRSPFWSVTYENRTATRAWRSPT
jgi:hypothetical protein